MSDSKIKPKFAIGEDTVFYDIGMTATNCSSAQMYEILKEMERQRGLSSKDLVYETVIYPTTKYKK